MKRIMKKLTTHINTSLMILLFSMMGFMTSAAAAETPAPSLLIYINPQEYSHEVRLGYLPYFSAWVRRGPLVEKAAKSMLTPLFKDIALCEGSNAADLIVWLKPQLAYNPIGGYSAKVVAQFHLGNGKHLGNLTGHGKYYRSMDSGHVEEHAQQAYNDAMQDIARQYPTDNNLLDAIRSGLAKDYTKAPCAMVSMVPTP